MGLRECRLFCNNMTVLFLVISSTDVTARGFESGRGLWIVNGGATGVPFVDSMLKDVDLSVSKNIAGDGNLRRSL